jgi:phage-related protein
MKEVEWYVNTLKEVQGFPVEIKKEIGYLIHKLQLGDLLNMPHSRSMSSVATGCHELRVKGSDGIYRVFYILKVKNKVIVFHVFKKKSQQTPKKEIDAAKKNLKEMLDDN